jgi:hypothetical protein
LLDKRGIRPGSGIRLRERNYDKTLSVATSAGTVVLGNSAAEKIWIRPARSAKH